MMNIANKWQHWSVAIHPNAWIPSRAHLPSASHPRKPLSAHITHLSPTFLSTFSTIGITSHPLGASLHPLHPASTQHSHDSQFSPTISSQAPLPNTPTQISPKLIFLSVFSIFWIFSHLLFCFHILILIHLHAIPVAMKRWLPSCNRPMLISHLKKSWRGRRRTGQ